MQDLPAAEELIDAVREFLTESAMPELSGRTRFHARVAANVLGIVSRQLEMGEQSDEAEADRLRALLVQDGSLAQLNEVLCRRIRTGEIGVDDAPLVEHLWQTTLAKLAIDQPSYAAYRRIVSSGE